MHNAVVKYGLVPKYVIVATPKSLLRIEAILGTRLQSMIYADTINSYVFLKGGGFGLPRSSAMEECSIRNVLTKSQEASGTQEARFLCKQTKIVNLSLCLASKFQFIQDVLAATNVTLDLGPVSQFCSTRLARLA